MSRHRAADAVASGLPLTTLQSSGRGTPGAGNGRQDTVASAASSRSVATNEKHSQEQERHAQAGAEMECWGSQRTEDDRAAWTPAALRAPTVAALGAKITMTVT
ncbi:hypothetical protein DSL92_03630 [Billgrantia gudaonensis]|uniref:Uncharacterized protein n=1 Tax=Billgrantia gudaonensis TaxID=376427 RepID=A0A3S0NF00_9GAMM|nr:hypothetical protein DSL92_03630 [Halomonas gudaonensis]